MLEFNEAGDLIGHWGGPGPRYDWPETNHGITVDYKGNVWIGGNGRGGGQTSVGRGESDGIARTAPFHDNMILKFTQDGKFLMQIGKPNASKGSNDTENVKGAAKMFVDPKTNELIVADGYGNHRVIVFDADTGKYKRHWGAYGHKPDDTNLGRTIRTRRQPSSSAIRCIAWSFRTTDFFMCATGRTTVSRCSKTDGTFVKEQMVEKRTLGDGSVWDIAFSKDPQQSIFTSRTGRTKRSTCFSGGTRWRRLRISGTAAAAGPVLCGPQYRDGFEG